ncbi:MAG: CRISPR-associated endonuclease Cas3'' [gamma proteobacterium symbiont of Taylorina sp.]|nr:CRISPR-associated endonuclease Cas3'' [gamma proteobacterium symbiont of Taylorina sp.]
MEKYFKYWGKTDKYKNYHLLPYHSLDVAAIGWHLLDPDKALNKRLSKELEIDGKILRLWFCFCLTLHDIGKFSCSFQGLVIDLSENLVSKNSQMPYSERHDSLGFLIWEEFLCDSWINSVDIRSFKLKQRYLKPWFEVVTGHHGVPPEKGLTLSNFFMEEDKLAARDFLNEIQRLFLNNKELSFLSKKTLSKKIKLISWQLAGIAVLADWLGSDQKFFSYQKKLTSLEEYWQKNALIRAKECINSSQFSSAKIEPYKNIKQLFPFIKTPTPLQHYAMTVKLADEPQIFMLEDVTGSGKTEAALILSHRLMSKGLSDGLYIGLPTMATAMFPMHMGMNRPLIVSVVLSRKYQILPIIKSTIVT